MEVTSQADICSCIAWVFYTHTICFPLCSVFFCLQLQLWLSRCQELGFSVLGLKIAGAFHVGALLSANLSKCHTALWMFSNSAKTANCWDWCWFASSSSICHFAFCILELLFRNAWICFMCIHFWILIFKSPNLSEHAIFLKKITSEISNKWFKLKVCFAS